MPRSPIPYQEPGIFNLHLLAIRREIRLIEAHRAPGDQTNVKVRNSIFNNLSHFGSELGTKVQVGCPRRQDVYRTGRFVLSLLKSSEVLEWYRIHPFGVKWDLAVELSTSKVRDSDHHTALLSPTSGKISGYRQALPIIYLEVIYRKIEIARLALEQEAFS